MIEYIWAMASATTTAVHVRNFTESPGYIAVRVGLLVLVALVFAYIYERTGNLTVSILTHGLYDAALYGIAYVGTLI